MPNMKFSFLYRDAANGKTFADRVFANPDCLARDEVQQAIRQSCTPDGCFDPRAWGLPDIRVHAFDPELDHDWYEVESLEETEDEPTDARSLSEFLACVQAHPLVPPF